MVGVGARAGLTAVSALMLLLAACDGEHAAPARAKIRGSDGPRVAQIILDDLQRHREGLRHAAALIAAGFVKVAGEQQEQELRQVFKLMRSPKRGVPQLVISPLSFIAAVGPDGVVIARDSEPDAMKGMQLGEMLPVVKRALAGDEGYQIGEFPSLEEGGTPSVTLVMAAPSRRGDRVVGALVLGIPLWRWQQRLSKQLQAEASGSKQGVVLWVYLYRGAELFHHGTPRDLDLLVPDAATRAAGLKASPGGFTGEVNQFGYWYGYGVRPLRVLGPDLGAVVFRMEPR